MSDNTERSETETSAAREPDLSETQASAADGAAGAPSPEAAVPAGATAAESELAALRDRHLRRAAEFDNFRKRTERERLEITLRAQAQLLGQLLEPLDDLQRIADFDPATTSSTSLHEGAEMVERKFLRVMEAVGLETIQAQDQPFDPAMHEALTTMPAESAEQDDTVAQVYQKGYRYKGILLRPARVVVRKFNG